MHEYKLGVHARLPGLALVYSDLQSESHRKLNIRRAARMSSARREQHAEVRGAHLSVYVLELQAGVALSQVQ